jgi:hypothetical protein
LFLTNATELHYGSDVIARGGLPLDTPNQDIIETDERDLLDEDAWGSGPSADTKETAEASSGPAKPDEDDGQWVEDDDASDDETIDEPTDLGTASSEGGPLEDRQEPDPLSGLTATQIEAAMNHLVLDRDELADFVKADKSRAMTLISRAMGRTGQKDGARQEAGATERGATRQTDEQAAAKRVEELTNEFESLFDADDPESAKAKAAKLAKMFASTVSRDELQAERQRSASEAEQERTATQLADSIKQVAFDGAQGVELYGRVGAMTPDQAQRRRALAQIAELMASGLQAKGGKLTPETMQDIARFAHRAAASDALVEHSRRSVSKKVGQMAKQATQSPSSTRRSKGGKRDLIGEIAAHAKKLKAASGRA